MLRPRPQCPHDGFPLAGLCGLSVGLGGSLYDQLAESMYGEVHSEIFPDWEIAT